MGIQVSFKGITEKGIKRTAAAKSINEKGVKRSAAQAKGTNPLYEDKGNTGTNPMHESAAIANGQPGNSTNENGAQQRAADSTAHNPLYDYGPGATINPLFEGANLAAGSPIGGIVVKGGRLNNIIYRELLTRGLIMPGTPLNNYQFTITIKTGIINRKSIN